MIRNLRRFGFPGALLVLGAVAAVTYVSLHRTRDALAWRQHTYVVIGHIQHAQALTLGAESSRRAYRLSHDRANFDRMNDQIGAAYAELDTLRTLTSDNSIQQAIVDGLKPVVHERMEVMRDGIELPDWELLDTATRDAQRKRQLHGSELGKLIDAKFDILRTRELTLLEERDARATTRADQTAQLILYGGVLGIALLAFFYASLVVEHKRSLKAQAELQRSTAIVKGVLDGTTDAVAVKDLQGRYVLANPAVLKNFRRPEAEVLGKTDAELIPNETGLAIMAVDRDIVRSSEVKTFEQRVTIADDRSWIFLSTKGPYRDADGNVAGIIAISRDITERKKAEAQVASQNAERGEIIARLERQTAGLAAMADLAARLHATQDRDETCQVIAGFAAQLFGPNGELGLVDPGQDRIERVARWGDETAGLASSIPIVAQGEVLGLLQLTSDSESGDADDRRHFLLAFTEQVALALTNLRLRENLQNQAVRDPLTGLFNRRYLDEMFSRELSRAARKGAALTVLMVDIDYFKRINDTFGHAGGDEVLRRVARHLAGGVRREDIVCRFGGEEFALIMPDLSPDLAVERAEKLRRGLADVHVELAGRPLGPITASFGVATYPGYGNATCNSLIESADEALYRAKKQGRNCVVSATVELGRSAG